MHVLQLVQWIHLSRWGEGSVMALFSSFLVHIRNNIDYIHLHCQCMCNNFESIMIINYYHVNHSAISEEGVDSLRQVCIIL